MEKRAVLAFVLSLLVLVGYQYFFLSKVREPEKVPAGESPTAERLKAQKVLPESSSMTTGTAPALAVIPSSDLHGAVEEYVSVETDLAVYRISTRGGVIKEIHLKKYLDDTNKPVRLVSDDRRFFPLHMMSQGKALDLPFAPSIKALKASQFDRPETLEMVYEAPSGGRVVKVFAFERGSYRVRVTVQQNLLSEYDLIGDARHLEDGEKPKEPSGSQYGPVVDQQGKIRRFKLKDIKERTEISGKIPWIAFDDKYFMTGLIPESQAGGAVLDRLPVQSGSDIVLGLKAQGEALSFSLYAGPKDLELLRSFGVGLEKVMNFGWFGFLAKPIFYVLKTIYGWVGNYGVSIIFLTTAIKVLFWPLTHKQQKSMKDMQKLQPEMNAIREKFKSDPQRMNREVLDLYKKNKVNPAAGCLPLVIQIPVFFALYYVLLNAIELRGAPFLYLQDLSAPDALLGRIAGFSIGPLPLLMGASMYYQQKLTPTTMDPAQARIFQLLPFIFTFMFLNFPSGLVLYWLVNNVLTIVQQLYINKRRVQV